MVSIKVSVCIMIKNEEKNLYRCLKSIQPILDAGIGELIIVDTGSEDSSIDIAKQYTDRIYEHKWTNDFAEMRNITISYAVGEWVFIIDADEEIENPDDLVKLLTQDLAGYNTIRINLKNYLTTNNKESENSYNVCALDRLFRKTNDFKFVGKIHEQPKSKPMVLFSDVFVGHYGYIWEDEEFTRYKCERNCTLLISEIEKDPDNVYLNFQLAASYSTVDIEKSLYQIRKTYGLVKKVSLVEKQRYLYIYNLYGRIAVGLRKYSEAIEICSEGLSVNSDYIDLYFIIGICYKNLSAFDNALIYLNKFLECKNNFGKTQLSKNSTVAIYYNNEGSGQLALYNICLIYLELKEFDELVKYIEKMKTGDLKASIIVELFEYEEYEKIFFNYFYEIFNDLDMRKAFVGSLEVKRTKEDVKSLFSKKIIKFYNNFGLEYDEYYLLNLTRNSIEESVFLPQESFYAIKKLDYDMLPDYYGDILLYIIEFDLNLSSIKNYLSIIDLIRFMSYILENYKSKKVYNSIVNYLYKYNDEGYLGYWIAIASNLLLSDKLEDKDYITLFDMYMPKGISYIHKLYNPIIFNEDLQDNITNLEHRFFMYLEKAENNKQDTAKYILYLRKALKVFPMKKAIENKLKDIKEKQNQENMSFEHKDELIEYKKIFKRNIKVLIEAQKLDEAKSFIEEFLKLFPDDSEIMALEYNL
ncbi:glycosyl transferase [Clostridium zeae]|uniref:Glycosyl transferase n=1 Tax=Clostridium zeae TaxID=2759022 RepID=A0ABQ1E865_9CLOT|nr:glycosyltransferase family 2 protein [Clostridium zeae]GFZ30977.1 glycosyl transferase [Clostridium zeae]